MNLRTVLVWGVVALALVTVFTSMEDSDNGREADAQVIAYSEFLDRVDQRAVASVEASGNRFLATDKVGGRVVVHVPEGAMPDAIDRLRRADVRVEARPEARGPAAADIVLAVAPMLLLIGAWYFFLRRMRKEGDTGVDAP